MSKVDMTAAAVLESLTGHDEMAIAQHFGRTVGELLAKDSLMLGRAMVFVTKRRGEDRLNDDDAREFALSMTFKDVTEGYFLDEDGESEESGKEQTQDEPQRSTSPDGASSLD